MIAARITESILDEMLSAVEPQLRARRDDTGAMSRLVVSLLSVVACSACKFPPPPDVSPDDAGVDAGVDGPPGASVAGTLEGMWQGGAAKLRLVSGSVDEVVTRDARGAFTFASRVVIGDTYAVTVAEAPARHRCVVTRGTGTVAAEGVDDIDVRCTIDLPMTVATSLPFDWTFDPGRDQHAFATSLLVQGLTVRVDLQDATEIVVAGATLATGATSPEVKLAPGVNDVPIAVRVGGLSNVYHLTIERGAMPIAQTAYGKASNADAGDVLGQRFGFFGLGMASVAVDGSTMVVGAHGESSARGTPPTNNGALGSGAAYVYERDGNRWRQVQMLKAPNADEGDRFGGAVAVSGDYIAVGACMEDGAATAINGDQTSNTAAEAGAVYVYRRVGQAWVFDAYIKAPNAEAGDYFGSSVALDGNTLVVGAPVEDGGANMNPADNSVPFSGAVYVFVRDGVGWTAQARLKPMVARQNMYFGMAVDVEGDRLAVGADRESSAANTINGDQTNQAAGSAGAAYVFRRIGTAWAQEAYVKAPNAQGGDFFGGSVALDGQRLLVFAPGEDSGATGVGGNMADESASSSGAAYVFSRATGAWQFEAYIKTTNPDPSDGDGGRPPKVGLRGDMLAIGMELEDSNARGIGGDQTSNSSADSGAVYLYHHDGTTWRPYAYVKSSNSDGGDLFGQGAVLSRDGLIVVAPGEDGGGTMIDGDQTSNAAAASGAFYVFR